MRLLSILPFSPPSTQLGGAELQMHDLHVNLVARGWTVDVLADEAVSGRGPTVVDGVTVWGVKGLVLTSHPLRPGNLAQLLTILAWRRRFSQLAKPDIILSVTLREPAIMAMCLARWWGVPWIARLACSGSNGDFVYLGKNWLGRLMTGPLVKDASKIIALEEETRREARMKGASDDQIVNISNAVAPVRRDGTEAIGDSNSIVYVGRLANTKKVDTIIHAIAGLEAPMHLLVIGSGPERDNLEALARRHGIEARVRMLGHLPRPQARLGDIGCLVNSSESEGLPNAVLEAITAGVPVVLSDIPVHRRLATDLGLQHLLFPVGDVEALKSSLEQIMSLSEPERAAIASRSVHYADQHFSIRARDDAYERLFNDAIGCGHKEAAQE